MSGLQLVQRPVVERIRNALRVTFAPAVSGSRLGFGLPFRSAIPVRRSRLCRSESIVILAPRREVVKDRYDLFGCLTPVHRRGGRISSRMLDGSHTSY